ncbi:MAG TPA: ABC transporter permease [Cyclobacteriaceae bacterium]|nr:ABC transporter permease [Cyclobacteriaceae bacterium]
MLVNYLKLSFRLLARNPFFSAINVFGLGVGFAVFFILWPFTQSELKSDQFVRDHDRISRILFDWNWSDDGGDTWGHMVLTGGVSSLTPELYNAGHIESYTRMIRLDDFDPASTPGLTNRLVVIPSQHENSTMAFKEKNAMCVDSNFFQFFDLPFVAGDRNTALLNPESVAISESTANRYFGETNVVSQIISVNGISFTISGVFRDIPSNSHLELDIAFSNAGKLATWNDTGHPGPYARHYYKAKGSDFDLMTILGPEKEKYMGQLLKVNPNVRAEFMTQPLDDIAFTEYSGDTFKSKSRFILKVLATISMSVLLMAWMNYFNLTISRTKTRFKDIAARKMSGAQLKDLFILFICQAAVVNVIAITVGATLIQLLKQPFLDLFQIRVIPFFQLDARTIIFSVILIIAGIFIISSYSATVAIRFTTSQLLTHSGKRHNSAVSSILTTFQYTAAFILISLMLVSHSQLEFVMSKDLGIDKDRVVVIERPVVGLEPDDGRIRVLNFAQQIERTLNAETSVSGGVSGDGAFLLDVGHVGAVAPVGLDCHGGVDEHYIPLYGIQMLAGRNFGKDEKIRAALISQFAAERLGFQTPSEAVGKILNVMYNNSQVEVIGVFADYRVRPLLNSGGNSEDLTGRGQCLIHLASVEQDYIPDRISVKLKEGQLEEFVSKIGKLYATSFPGNLFRWNSVDDNINQHYYNQQITRNQVSLFTLLALAVACLGLLGMIANKVVDKAREMSIRKVVGAGHFDVVVLLLNSTLRQIVIAVAIGLPIAWFLSNNYLSRFTEQIELEWWYYLVPILVLLALLLVTIASIVWKAVMTNPIDALKHD